MRIPITVVYFKDRNWLSKTVNCINCLMVYKIVFYSKFPDILDSAGKDTRRRTRTKTIAKRFAFHANAIKYEVNPVPPPHLCQNKSLFMPSETPQFFGKYYLNPPARLFLESLTPSTIHSDLVWCVERSISLTLMRKSINGLFLKHYF